MILEPPTELTHAFVEKHPSILPPAHVFTVASGKGGVGKTNVVANLAAALTMMKKRVMVLDGDLGLANVDLFLGVHPKSTLADFFAGRKGLADIITPSHLGIMLLPAGSGIQALTALTDEQKIAFLTELDALTHELDFVLVDTGAGISDTVTYFATGAHEIIIVVTPEPSSLTDAYALVKVLASSYGEKRFWILANNVGGEREGRRVYETLSRTALHFLNTSLDFLGWIPKDPELARAVSRCQLVVTIAQNSPSGQAFGIVAEKLLQIAGDRARVKGNLQFFLARLLAAVREGK
ncbi:MAG: MinD/ParA family protein [Deltaproteobacteria bacterium]|nr:MinD/ParA family protein [Deltaproteobacteria bacterium]